MHRRCVRTGLALLGLLAHRRSRCCSRYRSRSSGGPGRRWAGRRGDGRASSDAARTSTRPIVTSMVGPGGGSPSLRRRDPMPAWRTRAPRSGLPGAADEDGADRSNEPCSSANTARTGTTDRSPRPRSSRTLGWTGPDLGRPSSRGGVPTVPSASVAGGLPSGCAPASAWRRWVVPVVPVVPVGERSGTGATVAGVDTALGDPPMCSRRGEGVVGCGEPGVRAAVRGPGSGGR